MVMVTSGDSRQDVGVTEPVHTAAGEVESVAVRIPRLEAEPGLSRQLLVGVGEGFQDE